MVVSLFLFTLFQSFAASNPFSISSPNSYYEPWQVEDTHRLSVQTLQEWTEAQGSLASVDSLLQKIAAEPKHKQILTQHAVLHTSQSLHARAISPATPRVIFHDKGLFLAITGNPKFPRAFRTLEAIEWNPTRHAFDFYDWNGVEWKTNPRRCNGCHGDPPRPLWRAYPIWPGAYGGLDDVFNFVELHRLEPFLKELEGPSQKSENTRYAPFSISRDSLNLSNIHLGLHLQSANFKRMAFQIRTSGLLEKYEYALLAALADCPNFLDFLPTQPEVNFASIVEDTEQHLKSEFKDRLERFNQSSPIEAPSDTTNFDWERRGSISKLRYLIEGFTPISMADWSLSYAPGEQSYSFSTGSHGLWDFAALELIPDLAEREPPLVELLKSFSTLEDACKELRSRETP